MGDFGAVFDPKGLEDSDEPIHGEASIIFKDECLKKGIPRVLGPFTGG